MSSERRLPPVHRMVAFVDAAVAIALTLLVLPLVELVPEAARSAEPATSIITGNLPAIGSFLLGFVVIARLWIAHHQLFGFSSRLTPTLIWLNLFWVLTITVLPFFVEMVSSFGSSAVVLRAFVGNLLLSSVLLTTMTVLMRRLGTADGDGSGPPDDLVTSSIAATSNFLLAFLIAMVVPQVGYYAMLALFLDSLSTRVVRRLRRS